MLCSMQLSEDRSGGEKAGEAGPDESMGGSGIVTDLKETWKRSSVRRSQIAHLLRRRSKAIHRTHLIAGISL